MRHAARFLALTLVAAASLAPTSAAAKDGAKEKKAETVAEKRAEIDAMAKQVLDEVLAKADGAKALRDKSHGWAAFDNTKVAVLVSGGGGRGVAVAKDGKRTYMKMGTAGVGLGLGAQKYQVLFFFETKEKFDAFVESGWQGGAGAAAAAGTAGANAAATFTDGVAIFTITEKGLMANADVSGTKYSKNDKLNP